MNIVKLTEGELRVMQAYWNKNQMTNKEAAEAVAQYGISALQTDEILDRLVSIKYLRMLSSDGNRVYTVLLTFNDYQRATSVECYNEMTGKNLAPPTGIVNTPPDMSETDKIVEKIIKGGNRPR